MSKRLSPREKLTKAVFGTLHPTEEQVAAAEERMYDRQAASVTDDLSPMMSNHFHRHSIFSTVLSKSISRPFGFRNRSL